MRSDCNAFFPVLSVFLCAEKSNVYGGFAFMLTGHQRESWRAARSAETGPRYSDRAQENGP